VPSEKAGDDGRNGIGAGLGETRGLQRLLLLARRIAAEGDDLKGITSACAGGAEVEGGE
jgi:hypothetical protein